MSDGTVNILYSTVAVRDKEGALVLYDVYSRDVWLGSGRTFQRCKEIANYYHRTGKRHVIEVGR